MGMTINNQQSLDPTLVENYKKKKNGIRPTK